MENLLEVLNAGKVEMLDRVLFQLNEKNLSADELKDWVLSEKNRVESKGA